MAAGTDIRRLTMYFEALASPVRLQLLLALREPKAAAEIRLEAGAHHADLRADRPLNRTTIIHHIEILEEVGLVERIEPDGKYVVSQQVLFSILDELGQLSRIRSTVELDVGVTRPASAPKPSEGVRGPRLLVVGGPREGAAFALSGNGPWIVGRDRDVEVSLDHDPHVSRRHVIVHRAGMSHSIEPVTDATNPTLLDLKPIAIGARTPLPSGAVLAIGASRLVFQTE